MAAKAKPTDMTGRMREKLAEDNAVEMAARAEEISMVTAAAAEKAASEIVDLTTPLAKTVEVTDTVEEVGPSIAENTVVIRVNADIEDMTFGAGNFYTFKTGQKYKVTKALADYLDELGYVWH